MIRLKPTGTASRAEPYESLLDHAPVGVYLIDADFRLRYANKLALPAFATAEGNLIGHDFAEVLHLLRQPSYADDLLALFRRTLETGDPHIMPEQAGQTPNGTPSGLYEWQLQRVPLEDGRHGVVCYFRDISEEVGSRRDAQRLASVVQSSDDAILTKDLNGIITSWNQGAQRLFGYTAEEAIGRPVVMLIPPERQNEEPGILARIRSGERIDHYETVRRRKDGSLVDISLSVSPLRDESGRVVGASKIARDISLRRQSENMRTLLLNELNHRVKNTLASVQAIVQQTLRSTTDPNDFAQRFTGRIQSLARVHAMLTDATWQGADLRQLIADQVLPGPVDAARVITDGPAVQLEPQTALHLALMLHELATNSVKYGALAAPQGHVTLTWQVRDRLLHLRWVERGGPPVQAPLARGFGSSLIEQSATSEGGSATMGIDSGGVTWDIVLRLSNAVAAASPKGAEGFDRPSVLGTGGSTQEPAPNARLAGMRFLVVEDEPLIAIALASVLESAGAAVTRTVGTHREALHTIDNADFDAALLDANLHGKPVEDIAAALERRDIPFLFVTGYGHEGLPQAFRHHPVVIKPFGDAQLLNAAASLRRHRG
jgi:PAS domain S-box-containing protein